MKDDSFKRFLLEKKSVHLPDDFDNDMMFLIKKHALNKSKMNIHFKLMYFFFILGLLLGFIIAITFVDLEFFIGNNKFLLNKIVLQIPLIVTILFLFEKIYKATLVSLGKEKFSSI
ncbi:MAG: hypothetical protein R6W78_13075 [Bacteroidales bacterium]